MTDPADYEYGRAHDEQISAIYESALKFNRDNYDPTTKEGAVGILEEALLAHESSYFGGAYDDDPEEMAHIYRQLNRLLIAIYWVNVEGLPDGERTVDQLRAGYRHANEAVETEQRRLDEAVSRRDEAATRLAEAIAQQSAA